ncbi:MAG TPA: DUF899 domain-containing protein, partial [Thermoanaerobaculia bacterium]|nr:DUF899 domain-containing protein [Thermoanaerobaculia bacterium]
MAGSTMTESTVARGTVDKGAVPHPKIVSQEEWLAARKSHLEHEKEMTRRLDRLRAERRRLPMVRIDKPYVFAGPRGKVGLGGLFEGRRQLIVYHFMFDPSWDKGCPSCTKFVDALGDLSMLEQRDTTFALVSRAPLPKLEAYKALRGWSRAWYSSFGSDFNYDFHVTLDPKVAPVEYNYRDMSEKAAAAGPDAGAIEGHGLSVFFHLDDEVFHTYSAYARGIDLLSADYNYLDLVP